MQNTSVELLLWTGSGLLLGAVSTLQLWRAWGDLAALRHLPGRNGRSRTVAWQGVRNEALRVLIAGIWSALGLTFMFVPSAPWMGKALSWGLITGSLAFTVASLWDARTRALLLALDARYREEQA